MNFFEAPVNLIDSGIFVGSVAPGPSAVALGCWFRGGGHFLASQIF